MPMSNSPTNTWKIYVDGPSQSEGSGVGIVIFSLEGIIVEHALHLEFLATNNETEYEALIIGLEATKDLRVQNLKVYSDSQLVIDHVRDNFKAREESMIKYLKKVRELISNLLDIEIQQIPREDSS